MLTPIELLVTLFTALCIALAAHFAHATTLDQKKQINQAIEEHELKPLMLENEIKLLEKLTEENPKDEPALSDLAHLYFLKAVMNPDEKERIKVYQKAIDTADKALELDSESTQANFWKAASTGKQGLDIGISRALHNAKPMKLCLEVVVKKDEKMEQAGAYRALGQLYMRVPGWPFSFGDNKKAEEYLKKAVEIGPNHIGNHTYFGEVLIKNGKKEEGKKQLLIALNTPVDENHKVEMKTYTDLAKELLKKLE